MRTYLPGTSHEPRDGCPGRYHDTYSARRAGCTCPKAVEDQRLYRKRLSTGRTHALKVPIAAVLGPLRVLRGAGHSSAAIAEVGGIGKREINRLLARETGWVRPGTVEGVLRAWKALRGARGGPQPIGSVVERRARIDDADRGGRSAVQVAALVGVSPRSVKRRRVARRAQVAGGQVAA